MNGSTVNYDFLITSNGKKHTIYRDSMAVDPIDLAKPCVFMVRRGNSNVRGIELFLEKTSIKNNDIVKSHEKRLVSYINDELPKHKLFTLMDQYSNYLQFHVGIPTLIVTEREYSMLRLNKVPKKLIEEIKIYNEIVSNVNSRKLMILTTTSKAEKIMQKLEVAALAMAN